jgi:hypothetical protein
MSFGSSRHEFLSASTLGRTAGARRSAGLARMTPEERVADARDLVERIRQPLARHKLAHGRVKGEAAGRKAIPLAPPGDE